jgi:hypothetical protein
LKKGHPKDRSPPLSEWRRYRSPQLPKTREKNEIPLKRGFWDRRQKGDPVPPEKQGGTDRNERRNWLEATIADRTELKGGDDPLRNNSRNLDLATLCDETTEGVYAKYEEKGKMPKRDWPKFS